MDILRLNDASVFGISEMVIVGILGILLLTFGYHIKKAAFFILWFILGYSLVNNLMPEISKWLPVVNGGEFWKFLLPVAGGLLVGLMGFSIEKICVGGICFGLVMMNTVSYFGTDMMTLAIGAIVGVILAGFAVMMIRPATIVATSVAGAYLLTILFFSLVPEINRELFYWPILIIVALLGSVIQFSTTEDE
ncbi:MAG: hypothetical protein Q4A79_03215 [Candidatus Saccharibacteria bacterium]|nr:hypothetical protein [Candidatus Saccharibacteria bacterium]